MEGVLKKSGRLLTSALLLAALFLASSSIQSMAAGTTWYVDDDACPGLGTGTVGDPFCYIHDAIISAASGDTVDVAAGTYTEDLVIPEALTGLDLVGAGSGATTIKGSANVLATSAPAVVPNIEVLADDVTIHGFKFQGPDPSSGFYSSGMVVGGANVEVYFNSFEVPNAINLADVSRGLQTYSASDNPTAGQEVDGLNIHHNDFTDFGAGTFGFEGIYINTDTGDPTPGGLVTITQNIISGDVLRGITSERSNISINNISLSSDLPPADAFTTLSPGAWQGINVSGTQDVTFYANNISGFWQQVSDPGGSLYLSSVVLSNTLDHSVYASSGSDIFWYIQDAIDTATAGDTIEIGAATYTENLTVNKDLTLNGEDRATTIIDGDGADHVVVAPSGYTISMNSLTIQNGSANTGGGILNFAELSLDDVLVQNNEATTLGGGIYHASSTDTLVITNSEILSNQATDPGSGGGGVYSVGPTTIEDSTIDGNSAGAAGGGIGMNGSDALLEMNDTVVSNNSVIDSPAKGGGIANSLGTVVIYGSTISHNHADATDGQGGGISTTTDTTIQYTEVSSNSAEAGGGGIKHWSGDIGITHSAIRGNSVASSSGNGGGLFAYLGNLTLASSEVSGNSAPDTGGGIHANAVLDMTNTTISDNTAHYGAIVVASTDPSSILNSTITNNHLSGSTGIGGMFVTSALTVKNSIFSSNESGSCWDIGGSNITSLGHNIDDGDTCGFAATGDQVNTDPLLGSLGDHGGETWTHLPMLGSPAIDAGDNVGCPTLDQRDVGRPIDGDGVSPAVCDVGAVEVQQLLYLPLIMR